MSAIHYSHGKTLRPLGIPHHSFLFYSLRSDGHNSKCCATWIKLELFSQSMTAGRIV